jgi:hypothetical protein
MKNMATKTFNLLILLLLIICLGGCGKLVEVPVIVMPPLTEPMIFDKDIIGKWELVAEGPDEDKIAPVEANGNYSEYLPNGEYRIFSSETNSYYEFKFAYQTDSRFLYLYYLDNSDGVNDRIYEYTIISRDTLKLKYVRGIVPAIAGFPLIYIYQRIK